MVGVNKYKDFSKDSETVIALQDINVKGCELRTELLIVAIGELKDDNLY